MARSLSPHSLTHSLFAPVLIFSTLHKLLSVGRQVAISSKCHVPSHVARCPDDDGLSQPSYRRVTRLDGITEFSCVRFSDEALVCSVIWSKASCTLALAQQFITSWLMPKLSGLRNNPQPLAKKSLGEICQLDSPPSLWILLPSCLVRPGITNECSPARNSS